MSKLVKDYLNKNTLTLMLDYYSGQKQVRLARSRGKKICSIMLPFTIELIEATGCVPISCYRLGRFVADHELRLMRLSKNIFGTSSLIRSLNFINRAIGPNWLINLADKGILGGLWKVYNESINAAKEHDYPLDACFGTRVYYGALTQFKKDIDFEIGYGTRCGWLTKFYQACGKINPLVFIDIPMKFDEDAFDYQKNEILRVIGEIEKITNKSFSEDALQEEIRLHNSIANSYSEILKVWAKDITAMGPLGFTYVLSMLHFGYTDRLTKSSKYFNQLLKNLLQEFKKNLK
ncbi:MAG: 2-hydroxyacyl-CoA dehydratase, partial [Candidatus Helarchaeota archaeon]|nr:2-hydroxyacyl-CoA dehydratase [Candidatus Helarchaeota archaeon]